MSQNLDGLTASDFSNFLTRATAIHARSPLVGIAAQEHHLTKDRADRLDVEPEAHRRAASC